MSGRLTARECGDLGTLSTEVDCSRIWVHRRGSRGVSKVLRSVVLGLSRGRAVTLGNHVFLPNGADRDLATLAHEVLHCRQYQAWGAWTYYRRGAVAQLQDLVYRTFRVGSSPYRYQPLPDRAFHLYGMEQQAQIVEDCFRGHPVARAISPFQPDAAADQVIPSA